VPAPTPADPEAEAIEAFRREVPEVASGAVATPDASLADRTKALDGVSFATERST